MFGSIEMMERKWLLEQVATISCNSDPNAPAKIKSYTKNLDLISDLSSQIYPSFLPFQSVTRKLKSHPRIHLIIFWRAWHSKNEKCI